MSWAYVRPHGGIWRAVRVVLEGESESARYGERLSLWRLGARLPHDNDPEGKLEAWEDLAGYSIHEKAENHS